MHKWESYWSVGTSPPSRWCGLKFRVQEKKSEEDEVTTFAVVWIEIPLHINKTLSLYSHHLRGGVD